MASGPTFTLQRLRSHGALALALVAAAAAAALLIGSTAHGPLHVVHALFGGGDPALQRIVQGVRLPAVVLAAVTGLALGSSGATMQALLRNPLADPYILGISGGAGCGSVLAVALLPPGIALPAAACSGALLCAGLLWRLGDALHGPSGTRTTGHSLLLAGVMINAFCAAAMLVIQAFLTPHQQQRAILWMMGSIDPTRLSPSALAFTALAVVAGAAWMVRQAHAFNLLALGDLEAASLGVNTTSLRRAAMAASAVTTAIVVAWTGLVGFIGLLAPHLIRRLVGHDQRYVIALSGPAGAILMIAADATSRALYGALHTHVPAGAVAAAVGAPVFVWLLLPRKAAAAPATHA